MLRLRVLARRRSYVVAAVLGALLLIVNVVAEPNFVAPKNIPSELGLFGPLALVALASTPAILSGGGGLDISIGPLMNFINIIFVVKLLPASLGSPEVAIPIAVAIGAAIGAINGLMVTVLRYPPMIATLCTFFVLGGANIALAADPVTAPHNWTDSLANSVGPLPGALIPICAVLVFWWLIGRTALYRNLLAVGASDVAAYSAGVNVGMIRFLAYTLGGAVAAIAGFALTGLIQSGDPSYGIQYALLGFASVALGGTPIGGGRGGLVGSLAGAFAIYLIQNLLLEIHVAVVWSQVVYGVLLILSVSLTATLIGRPRLRAL